MHLHTDSGSELIGLITLIFHDRSYSAHNHLNIHIYVDSLEIVDVSFFKLIVIVFINFTYKEFFGGN